MDEPTSPSRDEAMGRLAEMVLDHLGIPRAGTSKHVQELQDYLLPTFLDAARLSWLAASPVPLQTGTLPNEPSHAVYRYLHAATESRPQEIRTLNNILEELGVHALLDDVASSPDVAMLGSMPVNPYEERLLRATGHPNPGPAIMEYLRRAADNPSVLTSSEGNLEEAAQACLKVHKDLTVIINVNLQRAPPVPGASGRPVRQEAAPPPGAKPKRRRTFSGLGKLFSGLVLLAGNSIVIPTVTIGSLIALPVLGSLAGGIAAVGDGVAQFRREGE